MSSNNVIEMECREQPIQKIIVYNDRAEITRHVSVELAAGVNEVHLKNISQSVIHDSLRVDGKGDAVIHEVLTQDKAALREEKDSPKVAEIRSCLKDKQNEVNALKDKETVLNKRIEALDKAIIELGSNLHSKEHTLLVDDTFLEGMTKFHSFYEDQSTNARSKQRDIALLLENVEAELNKINNELNTAEANFQRNLYSKIFIIVLESKEGGNVELDVTYQVFNASWNPSYDLRVDTTEKPSLKLSYYGQITQNTGEDWNDVPIVLSTAKPCLGGNIPELGTLEASFYRPPVPTARAFGSGGSGLFGSMAAAPKMAKCNRMSLQSAELESICDAAPVGFAMASQVQEQTLSTEFTISRPASIPTGGDSHKVTIGIVDMKPYLVYECVPAKSTSVFLTASTVNESKLPLLSGEASVYLNNSFVAKTHLKNISPGERFSCSLGVDSSIRVTYRPVKKYHEQVGLINKSSSNITEQVINVKNTRNVPVLLTLREHIPRSTDEKIKIRVVSPSPITPVEESTKIGDEPQTREKGAKLNAQNNLEWTVKLGDGQVQDFTVKWAMDHPKEEKVVFSEKY